ncbi:DUF4476 domain-containing protein [Paracrocinitomix mangrovi]|uniref:DUF4476 domain-containing protein n=1 Tax=Paracrocinitomix mangrovi TaxID=2862509 RepID=UPI001C8E0959|nr:DUF4476 domain-containing protein [Paracrocinitomix mangrovi]UKN01271.1 DUF4476 domain-containing protein [Paracrocinitomix mangrovi]
MKNFLLLTILFIGANLWGQGQGDVTIYSNTGKKFYVVLNGIRQNMNAETNVKVTGLKERYYSAKIIAEDNSFEIDKNIGVKYDSLITYRIIEKKGNYKMRFYSETPLGTSTSVPDQTIVQYHPTEITETTSNTQVNNSGNKQLNSNVNGGTETVTTTTVVTTSTTEENVGTSTNVGNGNGSESINMNISINESENGASVNMNVSGTGIDQNMNTSVNGNENGINANSNVNVSGNGENMNTTSSSSSSSTTTSTTTTSSSNGNSSTYYEESTTTTNGGTTTTTYYEETTTSGTTTNNTSNEGNIFADEDLTVTLEDCSFTDDEAKALAELVKNESFSDDQERVANAAAKNKCMSVAQIKTVANEITFSDVKLSFLKTAYNRCWNKSDYYQLMEILTFSDDKEELEKYINTH